VLSGRTLTIHGDLSRPGDWANRVRDRLALEWVQPEAADFTHGWSHKGAPYLAAAARRGNGRVHLEGVVAGGTVGQPMFILPEPFRPLATVRFLVDAGGTPAALEVNTGGQITVLGGSNTAVCLDGVTFLDRTR